MSVSSYLLERVAARVEDLQLNGPRFKEHTRFDFPSKVGDDGDACLFNGLLASTGYGPSIDAVEESQGSSYPYSGMFFRSPYRMSIENKGYSHFFSRDMAQGVLAYLTLPRYLLPQSRKKTRADAWLKYIEGSRPCAVKKPWGGGCLIRGPRRFAPDDRSLITPNLWALMGRVWDYNGFARSSEMARYDKFDGDLTLIEAEKAPLGYQTHLKAVQAYIKLRIRQSREYREKLAKICYEKHPDNLFYRYLHEGEVTDGDLQTWLTLCPTSEKARRGKYWTWEKSDILEGASGSMGWDFVFLGRVYLNHVLGDSYATPTGIDR